MALASTTVWEVQTGGNDTNNGGAFDPGQTAGMFTDGAATSANTSAPVFTSASYNFVAGDVGAWVYIASGTNWTAGWYKIASVAANAATLTADIGLAVLKLFPLSPSTVLGCATVASPTIATWTIDYSQQSAARFAYTDLASAGAGLTVMSAALPFNKQHVGNSLVITSGTNFTTGRYVIASVAANVATVVGAANITTGVGSGGNGGQGGALASPGQAAAPLVAQNTIFVKAGTYLITSASTNIAGGCVSLGPASIRTIGYSVVRGDYAARPLWQASGIATFVVFASGTNNDCVMSNIAIDGASLTSSKAFGNGRGTYFRCKALNCTNGGFNAALGAPNFILCEATGCSTVAAFNEAVSPGIYVGCEAYANSVTGFNLLLPSDTVIGCLSYNNTGATSDGFAFAASAQIALNCTAYGNGRDGFRFSSNAGVAINCIAETNTGVGFNASTNTRFLNCGAYNNTGGATGGTPIEKLSFLTNTTASFFVNAAGLNFALNTTASAGATARAAGLLGAFPAASSTSYLDIGAVQHADPSVARSYIIQSIGTY